MDIPRKDVTGNKRRRVILTIAVVLAVVAVTIGVSRLRPAAPGVDRATLLIDSVKRGPMLRQVRGAGALLPEEIRWIAAETDSRVERIVVLPGTKVAADDIVLELNNPQAEQEVVDAEWQLKAAEAEYRNARVKLESDLMNQRAAAATVSADYNEAKRRAETDQQLAKLGVISGLSLKSSTGKADELSTRNEIEQKRIAINEKAVDSQMAVQQARVEQLRALAALKQKTLASLKVRAGIDGVLQELPVQVGQRVTPGTILAKVAVPEHLKAELKVPEVQAKDIQLGQPAMVDTHNGTVQGSVMRIDPAVQNGTVTVDIKLDGSLPQGARPDLSVEGTIDLNRLTNVLYTGRPAFGQDNSTVAIFRLDPDGVTASRVNVKLGRSSATTIEILEGLKEGDQVVLSDMSRWENVDRIRLR